MATFGRTVPDGCSGGGDFQGYIFMWRVQLTEAGLLTAMGIYLSNSGSGSNVRLGVFADNAGEPAALVAQTGDVSVPNMAAGWVGDDFQSSYNAAAGYYWQALNTYYTGASTISFWCTDATGTEREKSVSDSAFPNPAGSGWSSYTAEFCTYVTYTPTAGGLLWKPSAPDGGLFKRMNGGY